MDTPLNTEGLVSQIFKQAKGEEDAKMCYMEFLATWGVKLQVIDVAIIKEIIADEQNHTIKLLAMSKKYSKIKPTNDDLAEALEVLGK